MKLKTFMYRYPGDPLDTAIILTGLQFQQLHPDRKTKIYSSGGLQQVIPAPDDLVLCDACNTRIMEDDVCLLVRKGTFLYCQNCADQYIVPHKLPTS